MILKERYLTSIFHLSLMSFKNCRGESTLLCGAATYVVWSLAVGVTLDPSTDWPQHLIFPVMYSAGFFWWHC